MQDTSRLRILNLGLVSSLDSQAIYHAVATCMNASSADTIILCRPRDPYFCIGHHQNVRHVLDPDMRQKLGYPIVRRRLGGGVTYLDDCQLFYQCVFHKTRSPVIPADVYKLRLREPINMLNRIGVPAELHYTNEIEVSGRRIAGIGGGLIGEASVVVGNVLNEFKFEVMANILNVAGDTFRDIAAEAMTERITTLHRERGDHHWQEIPEILISEYRQEYGTAVYFGDLSDEERDTADQLAMGMTSEKYLCEYQRDSDVYPLTRLKISGSTSIELVLVGEPSEDRPQIAIVTLKNGVVEAVRYPRDLHRQIRDIVSFPGIRTVHPSELKLGMRIA